MATETATSTGSRSRSRNSNNRSRRGGSGRRSGSNRNRSGGNRGRNGGRRRGDDDRPFRVSRPKKKPSLWARILAVFGIGKKPAATKASSRRSSSTSSAPKRDRPRRTEPREPAAPVELTQPRLFVGNLAYDATDSDIHELFSGFGEVKSAEIVTNQRTQRSKGFAFVEMLSIDDAKRAIETLHNENFYGRRLIVSPAKSEGVHPDAAEDDA